VVDRLVAWLYGLPVALLTPGNNHHIGIEWHPAAIEKWDQGSRILSVSLPLAAPSGARDTRGLDFFENLLPEGPALDTMARIAKVSRVDTYGILSAFGRDCAGAIVILPEEEEPPAEGDQHYQPMTTDELTEAIRNLPSAPFGANTARGFRPSLPGFQRKLLAGRAADGTWQIPEGGAPSTWILKPDGRTAMATNEVLCLDLATSCGLDVPEHELLDVDGTPTFAIRRYDRQPTPEGVLRLHQEDGCQATATPPGWKYEEQGGPSLRSMASIISDFGDTTDLLELLRRVVFNVAVGNADAHGKNFSFLHAPDDVAVRLAPLYDVISTMALEATDEQGQPGKADTTLGQRVAAVPDVEDVTRGDLVAEGTSWRVRRATAAKTVNDMIERIVEATQNVPGDERVLGIIKKRTAKLASSK
jgi:serine/threonine-protein kinase HipA